MSILLAWHHFGNSNGSCKFQRRLFYLVGWLFILRFLLELGCIVRMWIRCVISMGWRWSLSVTWWSLSITYYGPIWNINWFGKGFYVSCMMYMALEYRNGGQWRGMILRVSYNIIKKKRYFHCIQDVDMLRKCHLICLLIQYIMGGLGDK